MNARLAASLVLLVLAATACEEKKFEPPDREARVAEADSVYSPALFDTVSWPDPAERVQAGNLVYADECRRCHGPLGRGDTDYARSREMQVPSLVEPGWEYGDDIISVRQRVFTGHPAGMPTWGIGGLTPRQIDAVSFYLVEQLRPEVLDGDTEPMPDGG